MKVRVIKEMPFAKVGEVFDVIGGDTIFITIKGEHAKVCYLVCGLIVDGWLEEVHILEDKLDQIPDENCTDCIKKTVKVVKEHYLEVFKKANPLDCELSDECEGCIKYNIKNIEEA